MLYNEGYLSHVYHVIIPWLSHDSLAVIRFMMQGSSTMQQEVDGVRILSEDSYEFLQVVPG